MKERVKGFITNSGLFQVVSVVGFMTKVKLFIPSDLYPKQQCNEGLCV